MSDTNTPEARSLVFRLLERHCAERGLRLTAADPHGHAGVVEAPDGRRWPFKGTRFALNSQGAAEIAGDKAYTSIFLKRSGLGVPRWHFVTAADVKAGNRAAVAALDFAGETGFPLYVKPNDGREGQDVMRVDTSGTLQEALHVLAARHEQILIQEEVRGTELRLILLDGALLAAIERHPPQVTGDGRSSLAELIGAHPTIDPADGRIGFELFRQELMLESVPEAGQEVALLPVANLSSGGTARIVSDTPPPEILSIARLAAAALALRYAAVDLIVPGDRAEAPALVLEVNAAPGVGNLARQGEEAEKLVEDICAKVFGAMFET